MLNTQEEREALVNLMLLARFSDKTLSIAEMETFEKIVHDMNWQDVISEDSFINEATEKVRFVLRDAGTLESFIQNNCEVFSDEVKPFVLEKLSHVFLSDGMDDAEEVLFAQIKTALGV